MELLQTLFRLSVPLFVVSSMATMGLSLTLSQIVEPLRDRPLVLRSLLANFLLMPLFTLLLIRLLPMERGVAVGLILLSLAAGAPFLPKLVCTARSDRAFSIALMLLLMVGTVFYMPLVLPLVLEGASVSPLAIARSLVVSMLIPLLLALWLRAKKPDIAGKTAAPLGVVSNLALGLLIVTVILLHFKNLLRIDIAAWTGILLFLLLGMGLGWWLGGSRREKCIVLSLGTAQRNIAAALIVAAGSFRDPTVLLTLVAVAILGLLIMLPFAGHLGRCTPAGSENDAS